MTGDLLPFHGPGRSSPGLHHQLDGRPGGDEIPSAHAVVQKKTVPLPGVEQLSSGP
jgi:hypothetical protein